MKILKNTFILLSVLTFVLSSFSLEKRSEKKVRKSIKSIMSLEDVEFLKQNFDNLPEGDDIYVINSEGNDIGLVYFGQADSRSDKIDYSIIFDKEGIVLKVDIIKYRENHGGEVGSKRWLKQFIGKSNGEEMRYKKDISAISGATISVKSMTAAIEEASLFVSSNNAKIYE